MNNNSLGKFIVIDGTDGSGKGTQTKILVDRLRQDGYPVETIEFPQYGQKSAGLVEEYLIAGKYGSAQEVGPYIPSIFYACDRFDASFKIKQWLAEGKIVIADRYASSNMGHQAGKIKDSVERDKFLDWLDNLEFSIFKIPRPDINLLLYMDPEISHRLIGNKGERKFLAGKKRDIHEDDLNHLRDASEAYLYVAKKYNWPIIECAPNGNLMTPEQIHEIIFEKIKNQL